MNGKIYLITNRVSGKQYVGKTIGDVNYRFNEHVSNAISSRENTGFARDIRTYGKQAFSLSVLQSGIRSHLELIRIESYYIALHGTLVPRGYNIMP